MADINDYYQKKQLHEQLSRELQALEKNQSLKKELAFENELRQLMEGYNKSARDVLKVLTAIDPGVEQEVKSSRPKRALKTYRNPHTGEVVKTRGGNHKTLNQWREQYGKEAVQSWQES